MICALLTPRCQEHPGNHVAGRVVVAGRIQENRVMDDTFADEPGRRLEDLLSTYGPEARRLLD